MLQFQFDFQLWTSLWWTQNLKNLWSFLMAKLMQRTSKTGPQVWRSKHASALHRQHGFAVRELSLQERWVRMCYSWRKMIFIAWTKPIQSPMLCRLKPLFLDLSAKMYETYMRMVSFSKILISKHFHTRRGISTSPATLAGNPDSHHRGCSYEGPEDQGSLLALGEDTGARWRRFRFKIWKSLGRFQDVTMGWKIQPTLRWA